MPELLDALAHVRAAAGQRSSGKARTKPAKRSSVKADPAGPLVAQVFKTRIDPFVHKLSFIRVFSGTLKKDDNVHVSGASQGDQAAPIARACKPARRTPVDDVAAGDIVAVAKVDELHTGLSLGELELPPIKFPTPMVGLAVTPKSRGDEGKLSGALQKIVEEDSTVQLHRDAQTHELVINGMSELHLQMLQERLKRRDKVEVDTKEPKIPYRETIQANAEGSYRHKKQIGRARPVRRSAHPHVPAARPKSTRPSSAPRNAFPACASSTTTRTTTSSGSIRSSAARFPTTSCRPWKRDSKNGWTAA